ncbi:MAG: hypothetical protein H0W81_06500 [Chloroflexi bacterium]|nr:hypothetical protein [Chloroflexota bacterium]
MTPDEDMGASGCSGLAGRVADAWDRLPVKGWVLAATVAGGTAVALASGGPGKGACEKTPLIHVYHPARFIVIEKCAEVTGTVVTVRREHDGDRHVNMKMDEPGWTNAANDRGQHGDTVVEFVPLGPKLPVMRPGTRLRLTGTKVYDQQHKLRVEQFGWIEMHPVFKAEPED